MKYKEVYLISTYQHEYLIFYAKIEYNDYVIIAELYKIQNISIMHLFILSKTNNMLREPYV